MQPSFGKKLTENSWTIFVSLCLFTVLLQIKVRGCVFQTEKKKWQKQLFREPVSLKIWSYFLLKGNIYNLSKNIQFSSVQSLSLVWLFETAWIAARQASLSITNSRSPPTPCPSSWSWYLTISSSVVPFSPCPQSFPASGSFQKGLNQKSQLFSSDDQVLECQLQHQSWQWTPRTDL